MPEQWHVTQVDPQHNNWQETEDGADIGWVKPAGTQTFEVDYREQLDSGQWGHWVHYATGVVDPSLSITGVTPGTTAQVRIIGKNKNGAVKAPLQQILTLPAAASVKASVPKRTQVKCAIATPVKSATSYDIEYRIGRGAWVKWTGTATHTTFKNLKKGSSVTCRARAHNPSGAGGWGKPSKAVTA